MDMLEVKKEVKETDDNVGRNIENLDPHPLPSITEWHRQKHENKKQHIDFLWKNPISNYLAQDKNSSSS